MRFPDIEIRGTGKATAPKLTDSDIDLIRRRANSIDDQQIKTDLFRLLHEVEKLKGK